MLAEGKTDMIGLSRQLLADPYWPAKAKLGKVESHPALHFLPHGLLAGIHDGQEGDRLRHQPRVRERGVRPHGEGGEAAEGGGRWRRPAQAWKPRGLRRSAVTRSPSSRRRAELGGAILGCCMAPGKDEKMKWYADWIRWQMADLSVDIRMRTAPTVADLRAYDVVINATGARSYVPDVHGLKEKVVPFEEAIACPKITCEFHPNNASRTDRLERKPRKLDGTKVVVWGDHYAAVDTATYFASIGKDVTIVTDRKEFAADVEVIHMYVTWKRFRQEEAEALAAKPYKYPVKVLQGSMVDEIRENEIVVVDREFQQDGRCLRLDRHLLDTPQHGAARPAEVCRRPGAERRRLRVAPQPARRGAGRSSRPGCSWTAACSSIPTTCS